MTKMMTLEEVKQTQLEILMYVDKICKENNIKYSLGYGTMLGAVRHKGFIPWDDDIDIILMRSEYEKLLNVLYDEKNDRYQVFSPRDAGYWYGYAKVTDRRTKIIEKNWPQYEGLGVNIDVFPIDYLTEESNQFFEIATYYDKCLKWCLTDIAFKDDKMYKRLIKRVWRFKKVRKCRKKGEWYWKNKINELIDSCEGGKVDCLFVGKYCGWDSSIMDEYTNILFENKEFQVIVRQEEMLKSLYGDYMQLPPEKERISNHDFTSYWR